MYGKLVIGFAIGCTIAGNAWAESKIPSDADPTCAVSAGDLNNWFAGRAVTKNGWVNPANSTTFDDATACNFYKWGAQMFLWLTTPIGNAYVFDGPVFYDVVHDGPDFKLQPNTAFTRNNHFEIRDLKSKDPTDSVAQAGGSGVLISQHNSLTYYGMAVNDVYAYYRTGTVQKAFKGTPIENNFPTTAADLARVSAFAKRPFPDGIALAMEIKTSWVDAATVSDPSRYVLIDAVIPAYDKSNPKRWTYTSKKNAKLAMVGIHVVGAVKGHPELVWSSFEHVDNAPDKAYIYTNTSKQNVTMKFDSSGSWIFMKSGGGDMNVIPEFQNVVNNNIQSSGQNPVQPVDVVRLDPWGGLPSGAVGGATTKIIANATNLVSLNSSVMTALAKVGDVRANYFQLGGIWTLDGHIPVFGEKNPPFRGSLNLSNATMETYHQFSSEKKGSTTANCFSCHSSSKPGIGIDVSHIFGNLKKISN